MFYRSKVQDKTDKVNENTIIAAKNEPGDIAGSDDGAELFGLESRTVNSYSE